MSTAIAILFSCLACGQAENPHMPPLDELKAFMNRQSIGITERQAVEKYAPKYFGVTCSLNRQMPDGTFADVVTDELAIEADWSSKCYEAIGQAIHYADQVKKRPAVMLLVRSPELEGHWIRRAARLAAIARVELYVVLLQPGD